LSLCAYLTIDTKESGGDIEPFVIDDERIIINPSVMLESKSWARSGGIELTLSLNFVVDPQSETLEHSSLTSSSSLSLTAVNGTDVFEIRESVLTGYSTVVGIWVRQ